MAKSSGLGDNFYIGGYNLSGDVNSLGNISTPRGILEDTGSDKLALERLLLHKDGLIEFTTFFNDATSQEHDALKTLPTIDVHSAYYRGTTIGNAAASMVAKQNNYDWSRPADGSLMGAVQCQANSFGLEWGQMLTAGVRTDTTATNGSSYDTVASASFGIQAYLQVFSFSGTSCTVTVQDSADNAAFATIGGLGSFTAATGRTAERIVSTNTTTVRRYLRVATTGTFSSCAFAVMVVKNEIAGYVT